MTTQSVQSFLFSCLRISSAKKLAAFLSFGVLLSTALPSFADTAKTQSKATSANPLVVLHTTSGDITIELFQKQAPITVKNFLQYVDEGFYNGTIFHRVVPGFVVQGGGMTFDFNKKKTRAPIKNESDNGLKNLKGTLSMARTMVVDSATSQFFINTANNDFLDPQNGMAGYAVFGKVIEGYDTVLKIEKEPRGMHRMQPEAPNYAVIIEKAERLPQSNTKTEK